MHAISEVELLCLTQRAPLLLQGTLLEQPSVDLFPAETETERENNTWVFTADSPIPMQVNGCKAIVNYKNSTDPMLTLRIEQQQASQLTLSNSQVHHREKRLFPRLFGIIPLSIQPIQSENQIVDWFNGVIKPDNNWIKPEPFMNFSVNGAAFYLQEPLQTNTKLLILLDFNEEFRGIARVVRCIKETDRYEIALYFEQLPTQAINHLTDMTLRIQDSMLSL